MASIYSVLLALVVTLAVGRAAPSSDNSPVTQEGVESIAYPEGNDKIKSKMNEAVTTHQKLANAGSVSSTGASDQVIAPERDWHNCPYVTKKQRLHVYQYGNDTGLVAPAISQLFSGYITTVQCAHDLIPGDRRGKEECFQDLGLSALGIRSVCKTITGKRSLYVYDASTAKIIVKTISIPVCCSCALEYV